MKKLISAILFITLLVTSAFAFTSCNSSNSNDNSVVIYTSAEDYRVEYMQQRFAEEFPDYDITVEYMSTGDHAAKLLAEGTDTACDISYDLEYGYMKQLSEKGEFCDLKDMYDFSIYKNDALEGTYYIPEYRNGGSIILNTEVLKEKGLDEPESYNDLLDSKYKGLISMPNPKSSGTGYMFYKNLVNVMGEKEALQYFDKLTKNILQYTESGSGPVNALVQKEAAIGLGMTGQAVTQINDNGADFLKIKYFKEGSPYSMYGQGIIEGKQNKKAVKDVFDFLINTYSYENCEKFFPEPIFKNKTFDVPNFPKNIKYGDMHNDTIEEKERLLDLWKY